MTSAMPDATDRFLVAWLAEGPDRGPADLLERAFVSARATRQRPGWTIPGWWVPETAMDSRRKWLAILVAVALLLVAILALAVSGSFREAHRPFTDLILLRAPLDSEFTLFAVDATGAGPRRVAPAQGFPEVSPDGRHVLFESVIPGTMIGIARTDGSGLRLYTDPGGLDPGGGHWSPDSTSVAWDSVTDAGSPYLALATPDSDVVRRIDLPRVPPFGEPLGDVGYAWSPDDHHVVLSKMVDWSTGCLSEALYVADIDTGAVQRIELPGKLLAPSSWSADGGRLAVIYADTASSSPSCQPAPWSLSVIDMATMATRPVVDRSAVELSGSVQWASGDRAFLYDERTGDGALTILSLPIDGGQATELATIDAVAAIWSPDRRSIAWYGSFTGGLAGSGSDLWVTDIDHPAPRRIASSVESQFGMLSWSRDGAWIAFSRGPIDERKGTGSLWLVRPDGTDETLVSKDEWLDYRDIFW